MGGLDPSRLDPSRLRPATLAVVGGPGPRPGPADNRPPWLRSYRPPVPLGTCPAEGLLSIFVLDESGSVTSTADPVRWRHAALAAAVDALGSACSCRRCRVALRFFDGPGAGPSALGRSDRRALVAVLADPPPTASVLGPALAEAEDLARTHPGPVHLAVLSDFELFDPPGVLARLAHFPGRVSAVVLRSAPPPELVGTSVEVLPADHTSPPTAVADAVLAGAAALRPAAGGSRRVRRRG